MAQPRPNPFAVVSTAIAAGIRSLWSRANLPRDRRRATEAGDRDREEALRENEERLRFALEAAQLGDWDLDLATRAVIRSARHDRFFGYAEAAPDWSFDTFLEHVVPEEREAVRRSFEAAIEVGTTWDSECRILQPSGTVRWIWMRGRIQREARSGRVVRMCGTIADITERRELQAERERLLANERRARSEADWANKVKDEFLATLSHELRSPLQAILGWSRILRQGSSNRKETERGLEIIERNATLQAQLIEDLLDMSRILSNKLDLELKPGVDLTSVIHAAIQFIQPTAEAKRVLIRSVVPPGATRVTGDARRLQQVLWNLLSNAVKFTPHGGEVEVTLEVCASDVEIRVTDTGCGIPHEFLPLVFERFRQQDSSTIRKHGGLGLGLAIARQLVELHGGSIRASSSGEGRGATFTVVMPAEQDVPDAPRPAIGAPAAMPISLAGIRVLAVDDEPDALRLMREILGRHGAEVLTAESVWDALGQFDRIPVDIVVSDIAMPGLDGYDLVRRIRQRPAKERADVPAIALTACAGSEDRTQALRAGFQVHLSKPVDPDELVAVVGALLGRTGRAPAETQTHEERILLVDDEMELRDLIARFLAREGHVVCCAGSIPEAVQMASEFRPTLLVVDWLLKNGHDGGDAVRAVREILPNVKAIVMSGLPPEQVRSQLGGIEVLDVLEKPFQVSALLEQLQRALS